MAKSDLKNLNFISPFQITDEMYTAVGAGENVLGDVRRAFKGGVNFVIRTASGGGGTLLVENTDYELVEKDQQYTDDAGFDVWTGYKIINAAYQACDLYFTYKIICSYTDVETISALLSAGNIDGLFLNAIINPDSAIAQRGTSFTAATTPANNDDTYLIDRWNLLSDGNDIVDVSQNANAPDGSKFSQKFLVATANKKFGIIQFIENKNSVPFDNKSVSISFQAKTTAGKVIRNLRAAILAWNGAADVITSDVISAWNAEGTNPSFVANWTAENVSINIPITTNWAKYSIENININTASMANLALIIWVDDTDAAVNDELFISQVQFNLGATATDFQQRHFGHELELCQRYYQKSYNLEVAPGTATVVGIILFYITAVANADHTLQVQTTFQVPMRATPTSVIYDAAGNSAKVTMSAGDNIAGLTQSEGCKGMSAYGTNGAASVDRLLEYHYAVDIEL